MVCSFMKSFMLWFRAKNTMKESTKMSENIETEKEKGIKAGVTGVKILILFLVMITIIVLVSYLDDDSREKEETVKLFKSDVTLICKKSLFINANAQLVKQSNGWSVYNEEYFIKDDVMLNIMNCSVGEEE